MHTIFSRYFEIDAHRNQFSQYTLFRLMQNAQDQLSLMGRA